MEVENNRAKLSTNLTKLFFGLYAFYIILNFVPSIALKVLYPILLALSIVVILNERSAVRGMIPLLSMLFISGQGKMLWNYHPFFHIAFDYLMIAYIYKRFRQNQKILSLNLTPHILIIPLCLHILWYILQMANFYNAGILSAIAAGRIYVLPIIFFLSILSSPLEEEKDEFSKIPVLLSILFFSSAIVTIYQMWQGEGFLLSLSSQYAKVMGEAFVGIFYRPFGFTELAGAPAVYFTVLVSLIFIVPMRSTWSLITINIIIPLTFIASIMCQVRSAYIKYFLILFLIFLLVQISQKFKTSTFVKQTLPTLLIIFISSLLIPQTEFFQQMDIENSIMRLQSIFDTDIVDRRSGPGLVFDEISKRLIDRPLGLGPGRTGAAAGFSSDYIRQDPEYGLFYSWSYDNFLISIATDLGIGMFLYLAFIVSILIIISKNIIRLYRSKDYFSFRLASICLAAMTVILIGNWGAIGLTYNPESFSFWLMAGIAMRISSARNIIKQSTNKPLNMGHV